MLIHHVSRWHSLHVNCASPQTIFTILGYLKGLSAPHLAHISVKLHDEDVFNTRRGDWHVAIFDGSAPLLCTVHIQGIALSNCYFPPAAIVELELDIRNISFDIMDPRVFTYMPNLRVLALRGSILWSGVDKRPSCISSTTRTINMWICLHRVFFQLHCHTHPSIFLSHNAHQGQLG